MTEIKSFPQCSPFLKWAGSKRRLLDQMKPFVPETFGKYFEPFLGGGTLFFALGPNHAEISDVSPALIGTYKAVKNDVDKVLNFVSPLEPNKLEFNRVKNLNLRASGSKAGAFIFLNKTCWNGLYRVNAAGKFNVPFGMPRADFVVDQDQLRTCSKLLRKRSVSIKLQDFDRIEKRVSANDFVFFDPPYVTSHNTNGFVDWNEKLFSWHDQVRLSYLAKRLVARGVNVVVTNADHPSVLSLYDGFGFHRLSRFSTLASDADKRRATTESLFYAGPNYLRKEVAPRFAFGSRPTI